MTAVYVVLAVLVALGWWYADIRRRPWKTCRACGGRGRIAGTLVRRTHGDCKRCGSTGRVRRFGARKGK